jgi:phosphatidylserine decarboxylase
LIVREGWPFIGAPLALAALAAGFGWTGLAGAFLAAAAFCAWFFRNPRRTIPEAEGAVVSPGDGRVLGVEAIDDPVWIRGPATRISVFLNVFDVHVNRTPIEGKVLAVEYRKGKFVNASFDKASEENERNTVCLEDPQGRRVAFLQIAGLIARRIVCYLSPGDAVARGQIMGLIRFGSRVEVLLPRDARVVVKKGERVRGGSTVVAWLP